MSNVTAAAAAARFRAPTALLRSASDDESWSNNGSERLPCLCASVRYAPLIHRGPDRVIPMIDRLWCAGLERPTRCEQPLTRVQNPENLRLSAHSPERINTKPSMPHLSILSTTSRRPTGLSTTCPQAINSAGRARWMRKPTHRSPGIGHDPKCSVHPPSDR